MNKAWLVLAVGIASLCLAVGVAIGTGISTGKPSRNAPFMTERQSEVVQVSSVRSLRQNALSLNGKRVAFKAVVADCVFRSTVMEAIVLADSRQSYTQALMGQYSASRTDAPEDISLTAKPAPIGFTLEVAGQFEGTYDAVSNTIILSSALKMP